jgi:multidrug resistance efflux pump
MDPQAHPSIQARPDGPSPGPDGGAERPLFRLEAMRAREDFGTAPGPVVVSPPWARSTLWLGALFCVTVAFLSFFLRVEQTGMARGVLRVTGGSQAIVTSATGTALEVHAHTGDKVAKGDVLLTIDSAPTKALLAEAEAAVALAEQQLARFANQRSVIYRSRRAALQERARLLALRARNQADAVSRARAKLRALERMQGAGVASALDTAAASDELGAAEREHTKILEDASNVGLQIATLDSDLDGETTQLQSSLQRAKDRRDALVLAARDTVVRAPADGVLETVLVRAGDTVAAGSAVARLVPSNAPIQLVAFLPERDRAFAQAGMPARVELDQFPAVEFGYLQARVSRLGGDLATVAETREALGEQAPTKDALYRVELTLDAQQASTRLQGLVRPGSLVTVRLPLRKRRVAAILFEPVRALLEGA